MKTLIIDNIDSFVYNIAQYVGIQKGNPIVLQNTVNMEKIDEIIKEEKITHIIISPGPKTPEDAGITNQVIKKYSPKIPTLGICLGHQCIAHTYGATITRAPKIMHGKTSTIKHNKKDIYRGTRNPLTAGRYHSLVIKEDTLPDCLKITARSLEDNQIMGIKHRKYPLFGIQFHPESILTPEGMKIIKNFLETKK